MRVVVIVMVIMIVVVIGLVIMVVVVMARVIMIGDQSTFRNLSVNSYKFRPQIIF